MDHFMNAENGNVNKPKETIKITSDTQGGRNSVTKWHGYARGSVKVSRDIFWSF